MRRAEGDGAPKRAPRNGDESRGPSRFRRSEGETPRRSFRKDDEGGRPQRSFRKDDEGRTVARSPRGDAGREPRFNPHEFYVWGRRTVEACLTEISNKGGVGENDKSHVLHIIVDKAGKAPAQLRTIVELAKALGFPVRTHAAVDETWPLGAEEDLNHQRVCLKVPEIPTFDTEDACAQVREAVAAGVKGAIGVVLDQVQDPRNFGAILRSAAFFGLKLAVFAKDRQALITPYVLKSSAGGAFQLKLVEVVNISRTLQALKEAGAWIVGMSLEDAVPLSGVPNDRPYVIVLGNEGKGLRQEVLRHCDYKAQIPGGGSTVDSLNVSVAAGVVFHAFRSE